MINQQQRAVISMLWEKNHSVVKQYFYTAGVRFLITFSSFVSPDMKSWAQINGVTICLVDQILSAESRARIASEMASRSNALLGEEVQDALAQVCGQDDEQKALTLLLREQFDNNFPILAGIVAALDEISSQLAIELVVVNEDWMAIAKTVVLWAKQRNIPSVHLAHNPDLFYPYTVHDQQNSDYMILPGKRALLGYADAQFDLNRCYLAGLPQFDELMQAVPDRQKWRNQVYSDLELDENKPLVVFGTTWAAGLFSANQSGFFESTLRSFFEVIAKVRDYANFVIKGRLTDGENGARTIGEYIDEFGLENTKIRYVTGQPLPYLMAANVVVAVDSGLLVESILTGTPAVNLLTENGLFYGPSFDADTRIQTLDGDRLVNELINLLHDSEYRKQQLAAMSLVSGEFNAAMAGDATEKIVALLTQFALPDPNVKVASPIVSPYVWQSHLDVEEIDATGYHAGARGDLVEMFSNNPKIVLDIGCAAGGTGELLKRKFPDCKVWGVETNRAAAKFAAERLDRVLVGKFEEFDLQQEGIAKGSLDGVILADVLEHMYNPWSVMVALQPYLSATAQVIISIPNVRNLKLMEDLAAGFWRYDAAGLLDITHIRFFTLKEFRRFLHETGFHVNFMRYGIDQRLAAFFQANKDVDKLNVELGRMTLANVGKEELSELCSLQFYINAGVGAMNEDIRPYHASNPYTEYLKRCRLTEAEGVQYEKLLAQWPQPPKVAVAIYLPAGADARLTSTVKSLSTQLYQDIAIWVLSPIPLPQGVPVGDRFHWLTVQGALSSGLSAVAEQSDAEWLAWLNAGDQLEPQALLRIVEAAQRHAEWHFIYTDEDAILAEGEFGQPVFKPDFDPNYLLSMPYLGGLSLIRRNSLLGLGKIPQELAGAEHVDLALRCSQRWGDKSIGHLPSVLYHRHPEGGLPVAEQVAAAQIAGAQALARAGVPAVLEAGWSAGSFRWRWQGQNAGMVSLLIAVRDDLPRLQRCIEGLFEHTRYPEFEILLLDNGSSDAATMAFLQGLDAMADPRLRVFRYMAQAPMAQLHNLLAREARGQVLGFMHFDCVPLDANWLDLLTGELQRPGVAAVAPRLLDGQGKLHGGGLILGIDGGYAPAFAGLAHDDAGPMGRAHVAQSFSALSGGMLLVRRDSFEQLEGFDPICGVGAEVDFCLRLQKAGSRVLWTPYVSMMCEGVAGKQDWLGAGETGFSEKLTIDDASGAIEPLLTRWLPVFSCDPAYNRNLVSVAQPFVQEHRQVLQRPLLDWKPLPRVLLHPADTTGCGYYRMLEPAGVMSRQGIAETLIGFDLLHPSDRYRLQPDTVVFQRQIYENQVKRIRETRKYLKPFMVYELDDLITNVPVKSLHRNDIPADTIRWLREAVGLCDRFIVSTEPLAQAMRGYNDDIRVVSNRLDSSRWLDLSAARNQGQKPRVGWAGGVSHTGDLELILDVVKELADEVDWVFLGMCPEFLRPYVRDYHPGVPFDQYPAKLASLGLDLALAPLELNAFNEAKSNLKLLEYGVLGYPIICTDIVPYQCDLPVTRVKNRFRDWVGAIRESLADRAALAERGKLLKQAVLDNWMLDDHSEEWLAAWLP